MKQRELDAIHAKICELLAGYADGLMTTAELVMEIHDIPETTLDDLAGLVDPNTGLRFRSK